MYPYQPLPPQQTAPPPRRSLDRRTRGLLVFLAAVALVTVGVTVYVLLSRLSDEVLTVIATIGCAAGVALPGLLLAMVVLLKRAEDNGSKKRETQAPTMTQPIVTVVPPMALPQPQPPVAPPQPAPATWEHQPAPRHFVVLGEEE